MARGRLVSRTLGSSRKFAALHKEAGKLGEFCQVLYPLIVANSDDFGRMAGDAFTVKHAVFPTSPRREADFQAALVAMHNAQLIHLYTDDAGQTIIQVCQFETHQPGLSKRTKSRFSEPPVNFTEIRESRKQLNGIEEKRTEPKGIEQNSHTRATDENAGRVRTFIDSYRSLHEQYCGVAYLGNPVADYQEACALIAAFSDDMLEKLLVYWFNTKDKFTEEGTRTVAKFRSRASRYAQELKEKRLA
jgi:hypothetical protein